jgi:hypothetical protein
MRFGRFSHQAFTRSPSKKLEMVIHKAATDSQTSVGNKNFGNIIYYLGMLAIHYNPMKPPFHFLVNHQFANSK